MATAKLETTGAKMNEARLCMTRIPKGAVLILIKVSGAPGFFWIGNVIVMAGVPSILQVMPDEVAPKLKIGVPMLSEIVRADAREGDIGMQLGEIAKANPEVAIGSYPFLDQQHGPNTNVVLRARDAPKLAQAKRAVEDMLERAAEQRLSLALTAKPSLLRKAIMVTYRPTQPEDSTSTRSSQRGRRPTRSIESIPSRRSRPT
jgi:molybdopterin-biosynthesis enzyme MoeA-like protein